MQAVNPKRNRKKIVLVTVAIILAMNFLVIMPSMTVVVYESIFNTRYETAVWMSRSVDEFEGLTVEECSFSSNHGQVLAGYRYSKPEQDVRGVVVLSHGLGCGGQNTMLPFADYFTSHGYLVFAYDATGNGKSEGEDVNGLPQGVADLDHALRYVKSYPGYKDLPIVLLGHSWGAYSAGAALEFHPDVAAAVLISGPDTSLDLMIQESKKVVGPLAVPEAPYLALYEWLKFGDYASCSVISGVASSEAEILIVQSMDDTAVSPDIGFNRFREAYSDSSRVSFLVYEDRGHDYLFCSEASKEYRDSLNAAYTAFVQSHGGEYHAEQKEAFMMQYPLDKMQCFALDLELMSQIERLYNDVCLRVGKEQ